MPRTYPYDHFIVPGHTTPVRPEDEKARVSGAPGRRVDRQPRYGRRFAETEDLAHARQKVRRLEELAQVPAPKLSRPRGPEGPSRGFPIGALPPELDTPVLELPDFDLSALDLPEQGTLVDLLESGRRHLRLLRRSIRGGVAAGLRLVSLPLEVARLAARRASQLRFARTS